MNELAPKFSHTAKQKALYRQRLVVKVGKAGLEPARLAALDPKSSSSANSDTSPIKAGIIPLAGTLPSIYDGYESC